jgi:hypothetical protein
VKTGAAEQKYDIELTEGEGRAWRPPLTMLRVLLTAWGDEAAAWAGRRVTLYKDPTVRYGKDAIGGIRISHLSHIDKPLTVSITLTRGKRAPFTVQPLPDAAPPRDFLAEANAAGDDIDLLRAVYTAAQQAGEPADTLNAIKALATPTEGQ